MTKNHHIALPEKMDLQGLVQCVRQWPSDASEIVLDFSGNAWVEPVGCAGLLCLASSFRQSHGQLTIDGQQNCKNVGYWQRMGFFERLGQPNPLELTKHAPEGRFSELREISDINLVDEITAELVLVTAKDESDREIHSHIVSESLNNVCQHSDNRGWCMSQFYPSTGDVKFAIVDGGIGLKSSLAAFNPTTDIDAIKLAISPGVTGKRNVSLLRGSPEMRNRGIGLTMITRLAVSNRGTWTIWSGDAIVENASEFQVPSARWQGVVLAVTLKRGHAVKRPCDIAYEIEPEVKKREAELRRLRYAQ